MKFRFVLQEPDDPDGHPSERKDATTPPRYASRTRSYEKKGADMVRMEQLQNGRWKSTLIANFIARIVTDIIRDYGDEERHRIPKNAAAPKKVAVKKAPIRKATLKRSAVKTAPPAPAPAPAAEQKTE
jgi:hypothetical protein